MTTFKINFDYGKMNKAKTKNERHDMFKNEFDKISDKTTHLDLSANHFYHVTPELLAQSFKEKIPETVTSLDLSDNDFDLFNDKSSSKLTQTGRLAIIFPDIPKQVVALSLSNNKLGKIQDVSKALNKLPKNQIKKLDLSGNLFGNMEGEKAISDIFHNLPKVPLSELNLSNNNLGKLKHSDNLAQAFRQLSEALISLDLSANDFGNEEFKLDHLTDAFYQLQNPLNTLNLSNNNLGNVKDATQITDLITQIAKKSKNNLGINTLKRLNLSGNNLGKLKSDELQKIIAAIPHGVTFLDLSDNNFSNIPANELKEIFESAPTTLKSLKLANNNLGDLASQYIVEIFEGIGAELHNINTLDLSGNNLDKVDTKILTEAFSKLYKGTTHLDLSNNNFGESKTSDEIAQICQSIPKSVEYLSLRNTFDRTTTTLTLSNDDLVIALKSIPKGVKYLDLRGNNLHLIPLEELYKLLNNLPANIKDVYIEGILENTDRIDVDFLSDDMEIITDRIKKLKEKSEIKIKPKDESKKESDKKFKCSNFDKLDDVAFQKEFQEIPIDCTELDLSNDNLAKRKETFLTDLVKNNLPENLTALNLSGNFLGHVTTPINTFIELFKFFPESLISFNLSSNILAQSTSGEIVALLQSIKGKLLTLDLSNNNLVNLSANDSSKIISDELIKVLEGIPKTVKTLYLKNNQLNLFKNDELKKIFARVPLSVTILDLSDNQLTQLQINDIISVLPDNVSLLYSNGGHDVAFLKERLKLDLDKTEKPDIKNDLNSKEKSKEETTEEKKDQPDDINKTKNTSTEKTEENKQDTNKNKNDEVKTQTQTTNTDMNKKPEEKTPVMNKPQENTKKEDKSPEQKQEPQTKSGSIEDLIASLNKKKVIFQNYKTKHYNDAANAATELHQFMEKIYKEYTQSKKPEKLKEFQALAHYVLSDKQPTTQFYKENEQLFQGDNSPKKLEQQRKNVATLKTHRQYTEIIVNLLAAVAMLVVPYLIGAAIYKDITLFKLNTKTGKTVDKLRSAIDEEKGPDFKK